MSFLKDFFESKEHLFTKGGKYERLYPVFEMADTFMFTPRTVTEGHTHIRDGIDLKRIMTFVVYALIPCVLMAFYNTGLQANLAIAGSGEIPDGWRTAVINFLGSGFNPDSLISNAVHGAMYFLPLYIVTLAVGGFWELLFSVVRRHEIGEAFLVTSLLFPLILPPTTPLWQAGVAISIGLVMGKEVFGGTGRNFVNPALISRAVLFFSYPATATGDTIWVAADSYTYATPLGANALEGGSINVSFMDAFLGFIPGSMGETSALACLIGAAFLIISGIGSWRVMLSSVVGLVLTVLMFNAIGSETNPMMNLSPAWHMVLGGYAFATVFMVTDPVSAAITRPGMYIYGFMVGALTAMVRVVNPAFAEGAMLAVLFGNVFAPVIDQYVIKANMKRRERRYAD
ncbi:NADH:ubiquinone reductase (Na(+)-transporting) subunit B [Limisalsivibrio acetivorans]|uniref:NADH:ubiquinone reductase (Na(+)-transporting) subunit B n=1 Tax=Limisalsivibrio acetivorans TaxID=1304888 RepID=UPI0003B7730D|nr:NADH:ubiquinone reductase (Na(+)-transporting) subunit B [Limisalsivibrio acetivorans]